MRHPTPDGARLALNRGRGLFMARLARWLSLVLVGVVFSGCTGGQAKEPIGVDPLKRGEFLARFAAQELKAKRAVVLTEKRKPAERPADKPATDATARADRSSEGRTSVGNRVATGFFGEWPRAVPASAEEWP